RESGLMALALALWPAMLMPRGRLRQGAWLATPEEIRHGLPVLLVGGLFTSRLALEVLRRRAEAAHRPALRVDLPAWKGLAASEDRIASAAHELSKACESPKIDIVGFGVGGIAARRFAEGAGKDLVERCVMLGSGPTKLAALLPRRL